MEGDQACQQDPASRVMGNPWAYPTVFASVVISLGLEESQLATYKLVSKSWHHFLNKLLWKCPEVQSYLKRRLLNQDPPYAIRTRCLNSGRICCFTGDRHHLFFGMSNGSIEMWDASEFTPMQAFSIKTSRKSHTNEILRRAMMSLMPTIADGHKTSPVTTLDVNKSVILSGADDGTVSAWDRTVSQRPRICTMQSKLGPAKGLRLLVLGDAGRGRIGFLMWTGSCASLWRISAAAMHIFHLCQFGTGDPQLAAGEEALVSADCNERLAVAAYAGKVLRVWRISGMIVRGEQPLPAPTHTLQLKGVPTCVSLKGCKKVAVVGTILAPSSESLVQLFDVSNGTLMRNLSISSSLAVPSFLTMASFCTRSQTIITTDCHNVIKITSLMNPSRSSALHFGEGLISVVFEAENGKFVTAEAAGLVMAFRFGG